MIHIALRAGAPLARVGVAVGCYWSSGEDGVGIGGRYLKGPGLAGQNVRLVFTCAFTQNRAAVLPCEDKISVYCGMAGRGLQKLSIG